MNKIIDLLGLSEFKEKIISLIPTKVSQLDNDSEYAKKEEINNLKKSVSDGKTLVANAITDKGIETAADAEFATMAENVGKIETGSKVKLQDSKTVSPSTESQTITADNGYDGLSSVVVNAMKLQTKVVKPTLYGALIISDPGYDALGMVSVEQINLQSKEVVPSSIDKRIYADDDYDGLHSVFVEAVPSQAKTATPSTTAQTIKPDSGKWLSQVTVNAIATQEKTATLSTASQSITPDSGKFLSKVTIPAIKNQSKSVSPTTSAQTIKPDSGYNGLSQVTVNAAKLQNKSVTPTSSVQTVYPDSGFLGLGAVSVAASLLKISVCEKLGKTINLATIPDGYTIYGFVSISNTSNTAYYYVNKYAATESLINQFEFNSGGVYAKVTVFNNLLGGTTTATTSGSMICFGLK